MSPRHAENDARLEANRQVVRGFCATINQRRVERSGEFMTGQPGAAFEGIRQQLTAFDPVRDPRRGAGHEGDRVVARVVMPIVPPPRR